MTPEQAQAYRDLDNALARLHQVFGHPGILVDWVVLTSLTDPQEDGWDRVSTSWFGSPNQPLYRSLGLMEYCATILRDQITDYD